jgi:HEAT repeat protein
VLGRCAAAVVALTLVTLASRGASALVWPDVPARIEQGLASTDPQTRRTAARELTALGTARATPLVLRALDDADTDVKLAAADSAMRLHVAPATEAVLGWLGSPIAALRSAACAVAGALPDARAVPALGRALVDTEPVVRVAAADALGAYAGNGDAVSALLRKLDDASPNARRSVVQSLGRLGDERAVLPLVGKAQDSVPEVRQAVARALGDLGDAHATQALELQLRDDTLVEVRVEALSALGKLRAGDAALSIAALLADRNAVLRQAAIAALGRIATPPAIQALVLALGSGDDTAGFERTPVREALVAAGPAAVAEVAAVLDHSPTPAAAASAAWVLGELHARDRAPAIISALRRGALPTEAALHALGGAGTSDSITVVLEFLSDPKPVVREQALATAAALLDPAKPDGRAEEPLVAASRDPRRDSRELATIATLLGRTGAGRAAPVLSSLARAKTPAVRIAAIDALGTLGPAAATRSEDLQPLIEALDDADPAVRLHAAVALGEAGDAPARDAIVAKLDSAEVDRASLLTALGGILSRAPSEPIVQRLSHDLEVTAGEERDAMAEAIGRASTRSAVDALAKLADSPDDDDARTAATLLAAHAGDARAAQVARSLLAHREASVRAQAAFALGTLGSSADVAALAPLLASAASSDEAIDAATAIGRIAARSHDASLVSLAPLAAAALCGAVSSPHAHVRAAAFAALSLAHARCEGGAAERRALETDPSDAVRTGAALAIVRSPSGEADARALARCVSGDRSGAVAARCRAAPELPSRTRPVTVYVVPDLVTSPEANAPYVVVLESGALHAGTSDRRGAVFDPVAPDGDLTLLRADDR